MQFCPADIVTKVVQGGVTHAGATCGGLDDMTKTVKALDIAGKALLVLDVGTNVVDAIISVNEKHYGDAVESGTKAILTVGVEIGTSMLVRSITQAAVFGSVGGPVGIGVSIAVSITWTIFSNMDW